MSISLENIYIYNRLQKQHSTRRGAREGDQGGGFKEPDQEGLKGHRQKTLKHICGVYCINKMWSLRKTSRNVSNSSATQNALAASGQHLQTSTNSHPSFPSPVPPPSPSITAWCVDPPTASRWSMSTITKASKTPNCSRA